MNKSTLKWVKMNKNVFYVLISVLIIALVIAGCDSNKDETTTSLATTATTQTSTTQTTAIPTEVTSVIEVEIKFEGTQTHGLMDIGGVDASATLTEIIVKGHVFSLRNSRAHVEITAEFYNSLGTLIGVRERELILNSAYSIDWINFEIRFANDNPSQIKKCKLIVNAYE